MTRGIPPRCALAIAQRSLKIAAPGMTSAPKHLEMQQLEAGIAHILDSPKAEGTLEMIVRRPRCAEREVLGTGELHPAEGLRGDNWKERGSTRTPDGSADPDVQLTLMNARVIALLAQDKTHWPLAGDQLYVDFDLSEANVPAGTQLEIGSALIEVTPPPHTGCKKFTARFGLNAMHFVNSPTGRQLHLRGINAKIVRAGSVRVGDSVTKVNGQQLASPDIIRNTWGSFLAVVFGKRMGANE